MIYHHAHTYSPFPPLPERGAGLIARQSELVIWAFPLPFREANFSAIIPR